MNVGVFPGLPGIESSLAETLANIEIPPRPALLDKVMAEMQQDEPDFHRLAILIRADVGMSASLIAENHALNHALVGSALAQSWFLPPVHVQAILHHHDLDLLALPAGDIPLGSRRLIALSHLAGVLEAKAAGAPAHEWQRMGEACLGVLDLSSGGAEELQSGASEILEGIE